MQEKYIETIKEGIRDSFSTEKEFSKIGFEKNFELLFSQVDFFKTISSFTIAIIGIGLYGGNLNNSFLIVSLLLGVFILLFTISYTREMIDEEQKGITDMNDLITTDMNELREISMSALKEKDENIYFEYINKKSREEKYPTEMQNYIGEIISFLFYLSIGFLLLSFLPRDLIFGLFPHSSINYLLIAFLLLFSYFFSFRNWAYKLSKFLSREIFKNKKNDI
ncbi:hypothetical protein C4565_02535 [Candidatus Parcubacteria bacterium]|nr:MAG: hypothetical protein C4565_02535 [Candidatus Parcubacteria bacterium]